MSSDASIFTTALEITDPAERSAYLRAACAADPALRKRVDGLLAAHARAGDFLEPTESAGGTTVCFGPVAAARPPAFPFLAPSARPDALGRLGHYQVLSVLGEGGFGVVFRAFDDVLQRVVAVKVLSPGMAATSPARQRFLREARAAAAIRHDNVVQVHATEAEPTPYLVMEFVPGKNLEELIRGTGPLPADEVARIGRQVALGLAAAHALGVVHRDIKPGNVLVENGPERRVKLTDFGLARAADDASLTQSGTVAGTPLYMSPEQAMGQALDHRSDLFSLGSVLYALLTGRPPFRADSSVAILRRVCDDTPRAIREIIPEAPAWLCGVIVRLHAKNPADRYQTAEQVADALARGTAPPPPKSAPAPARRRPKWVLPAAVAGACVALAAVTATVVFNLPKPPPAAPTSAPHPPAVPSLADLLTSPDWEWTPPHNLGAGVNAAGRDLQPALTADECEIVFVRDRGLMTARRPSRDVPFDPAEPLFPDFAEGDCSCPTLTADGLLLAFAAGRKPGASGDVWASERAGREQPFGPPRKLPAAVNGPGWTVGPCLSADGLTLLTAANRPGGLGGGDVALSTRPNREAEFAGELRLPPPVNSPQFDVPAWVSDDRRVLVRTRMDKGQADTRFHTRDTPAGEFGPPHPLTVPGVSGEVGRPWLSPDGMRMYFHTRELPGGRGDLDLWVTTRVPKGR